MSLSRAPAPPAPEPDWRSCPGLPLAGDTGPVFAEPWQAQAFAMTLALHQQGCFSWPEWAAALSTQIQQALAPDGAAEADDGQRYYQHWLAALETLVAAKGLGQPAELQRTALAWAQAAERTPHGQAIVLQPADYPPAG